MWGGSSSPTQLVLTISFMQVLDASALRTISADPGEHITLSCDAFGRGTIMVVEWSRADLMDGYVLLYRNKQLDPRSQLQTYRDRVGLDRAHSNVSLMLKNVTAADGGTYECRVFQRNSPRQQRSVVGGDPVCSIRLRVGPTGTPQKENQDGGRSRSEELRASLLCVFCFLFLMF